MKISEVNTKNIITKSHLPDADYVINPYIGCQHSCRYCYATFMQRFTGHINDKWGEFVDAKINAADTIKTVKFNNNNILIGSVTDPYQPIERKYELTRQILIRLLDFQPDLEILTKSSLIIRDISLLKKFNKLKVGISLSSLDMKVSNALEPFASTPASRINTVKTLYKAGIQTYLFISPIFPFVTNFRDIIAEVNGCISKVCFENLNIRANNRNFILSFIASHYPDLLFFYQNISINTLFWSNLKNEINEYCNSEEIPFKIYFNHTIDKK